MMKRINKQTDSSSSEDETSTSILKEAIDREFLSDNLYITEEAKVVPPSELEINKLKSLRINLKQENKFTNFGVTATFQSFIAKKLDEILERTIELEGNKITECCMEQKQKRNRNSGIKLLSTSKKFLTTTEITENYMKHEKKAKKCRQVTEDEALSKFREAAIDAKHILSKSDTKAWSSTEPEFKYKKLRDGTLLEI